MRALGQKRADEARAGFEQVVLEYPGSLEADQAVRELVHLNEQSAPDGRPEPVQPDGEPSEAADGWQIQEKDVTPRTLTNLRNEFLTTTGDRVFFPANSASIGARARAMLENQARWLQRQPDIGVRIIGRADDGGTADEARGLSLKRAEAVRDQLVALGLAEMRITLEARGDRDLVATCRSEDCKLQNRQAETLLIEQRGVTGERVGPRPSLARGAQDDASPVATFAR